MFGKIADWAEKNTIKVHLGRWNRWRLLEPRSPDGIRRFLKIERELASYLIKNNQLFRTILEGELGSDAMSSYNQIKIQAEVTYGKNIVAEAEAQGRL